MMARKRKHGGGRRRAARGDEAPMRSCVACRATAPKEGLLRFVRAPDGAVAFDVRARVDGRGAWTCTAEACVLRASERGGFARAFEAPVLVDGDLSARVVAILEREVLEGLGLLRRQARLWPGRTEALKRFAAGEAKFVVAANDLSSRSLSELRDAMGPEVNALQGPGKDATGRMLGRGATGVVAFAGGPLASRVVSDLHRWALLHPSVDVESTADDASLRSQVAGV